MLKNGGPERFECSKLSVPPHFSQWAAPSTFNSRQVLNADSFSPPVQMFPLCRRPKSPLYMCTFSHCLTLCSGAPTVLGHNQPANAGFCPLLCALMMRPMQNGLDPATLNGVQDSHEAAATKRSSPSPPFYASSFSLYFIEREGSRVSLLTYLL